MGINKAFIFLLLGLFIVSFASAAYTVDEESNITVICLNDGYCSNESICNINVINPIDNLIIENKNMSYNPSSFNYAFTPNYTGSYNINGYCLDGEYSKEIDFDINVTIDGQDGSPVKLISYFILLVGIVFLIFIVSNKHGKTDFDGKRKAIVTQGSNNMKKTLVSGVLLSLFKNSFIWIYFFGWFLVFILKDLVGMFLSKDIYSYFVVLANIYSLGFLLVLVFIIGFTIDFMKDIIDEISNDNWGIE